jgi:transcriptional regulator with XRE-family HTH domain
VSSKIRDLAANLRSLRELRGLTQADLAKRADMTAASVSHFETGQRAPSLESLVNLAEALQVSVDVLLGRASVESGATVDPVFLQASRADAQTLETLRRVTAAVLAGADIRASSRTRLNTRRRRGATPNDPAQGDAP